MADKRFPSRPQDPSESGQTTQRRRFSRIVHDHKGNAIVQWLDAPNNAEHRPVLEIEGAKPAGPSAGAPKTATRGLNTGALAIESEDTHNPYMRIPEADRKRAPGQRTDLRKLSAWIKMMRELEEAKKRKDDDD